MRKVNKILMATVAILLCLVLLSTSIVSGIFARYVIKRDASVSLTLERFDVKIKITPDTAVLRAAGATVNLTEVTTSATDKDTISVSITGLQMAPGDSFLDALNVQITGTPNTNVKLRTTYKVHYAHQTVYNIPKAYCGGTADSTPYLPIGFTLRVPNKSAFDVCYPWTAGIENKVEEVIMRNTSIALFDANLSKVDDIETDDAYDYYYEELITKGTDIKTAYPNVEDFYMGLYIPKTNETYTSGKKAPLGASYIDKTWMYILEKENSPISITYTFHLEQT